MFSKALMENFKPSDLSYGDNLWGSRRINRALSDFYNEYVRISEMLDRTAKPHKGSSTPLSRSSRSI